MTVRPRLYTGSLSDATGLPALDMSGGASGGKSKKKGGTSGGERNENLVTMTWESVWDFDANNPTGESCL